MILGEAQRAGTSPTTLDDLFRRAVMRHPQALALVDPPNRETITGGAPRQLTFAEADLAVSALAAKLLSLGLRTDTVVALQLANTIESVIALLGVLRAGMIAAPVPALWRRQDMVEGLGYIGAKAIITTSRIGACTLTDMTMQVAAELFPIRYICAFGEDVSDGVVPLDDIFTSDTQPQSGARDGNPGTHLAVVTFDCAANGHVPVARNHHELIAGGLSVFLESGGSADMPMLSTIPVSSFAGIAVTLIPWLLNGGVLHLHHGFDAETFAGQCAAFDAGTLVLPGSTLTPLGEAGSLDASNTIVALWRSPERMSATDAWTGSAGVIDVASFGESGVVATKRASDGKPVPIPAGRVGNPRGASGTVKSIETQRLKNGTLGLRGPMVPSYTFPPGTEKSSLPHLTLDEAGFIDTGFSCNFDRSSQALTISAAPGGFTSIGGYIFRPGFIEAAVAAIDPDATIVALPDAMLGQRLAGSAANPAAMQNELNARGVNPLISGAFRPRKMALG